jgi:hypothetical protein
MLGNTARCSRDLLFSGLAAFALAAAGETIGGERAPVTGPRLDPAIANFVPLSPAAGPVVPAPAADFTLPTSGGIPVYSTTEFRPRKRTVLDSDPTVSSFSDTPLIHTTTVWQRLSEYKSHDRVRVLTLWETSGSSVSLQAGRRGDPSLQWTSRLMNRGGSTHGLLDRLFSVSIAGAASGFRNATRSSMTPASPKPGGNNAQAAAAAK